MDSGLTARKMRRAATRGFVPSYHFSGDVIAADPKEGYQKTPGSLGATRWLQERDIDFRNEQLLREEEYLSEEVAVRLARNFGFSRACEKAPDGRTTAQNKIHEWNRTPDMHRFIEGLALWRARRKVETCPMYHGFYYPASSRAERGSWGSLDSLVDGSTMETFGCSRLLLPRTLSCARFWLSERTSIPTFFAERWLSAIWMFRQAACGDSILRFRNNVCKIGLRKWGGRIERLPLAHERLMHLLRPDSGVMR